jgi:glycosyltransferase involved in cell wall biosynthesis
VLTDSVCFLVEPDPESMAQGLLRALNDQAARERVVAAALELYETEYSRARYESKIRQLLEVLR